VALQGDFVNLRLAVLPLLFATLSLGATAGTMTCPDLASAVQVNACPAEDELKHTYSGFCSDTAKAYANQTDSCIKYEDYREMKNVALWESKDGVFSGYISCALPAEKLKVNQTATMVVERQGKLNKLVCSYPNGVHLTYRTKAACAVNDEKACKTNPASCTASCD
jgi:hypothetical protein